MRTLQLILSYDGTPYHGWQVQPGLTTVQQILTDALTAVTGERRIVHASGRTDAGVHALGQVVHFELEARIPTRNLVLALNRVLPPTIRALEAREAPEGFHARRDATSKLYRYRLYRGDVCPPFLWNRVYHFPYRLDEAAMSGAALRFEGEHDFTSFAATPAPRQAPGLPPAERLEALLGERGARRRIFTSRLTRWDEELIYEIRGDGFLHHMVRNIVGFLLEVGRGVRSPDEIPAILAARRRAAAARMAPACGLYLVEVSYENGTADEAGRTPH